MSAKKINLKDFEQDENIALCKEHWETCNYKNDKCKNLLYWQTAISIFCILESHLKRIVPEKKQKELFEKKTNFTKTPGYMHNFIIFLESYDPNSQENNDKNLSDQLSEQNLSISIKLGKLDESIIKFLKIQNKERNNIIHNFKEKNENNFSIKRESIINEIIENFQKIFEYVFRNFL